MDKTNVPGIAERYHSALDRGVGRLLGTQHNEHIKQIAHSSPLSSQKDVQHNNNEISELAKKDNRQIAATGINAVATFTIGAVYPGLQICTVPIWVYLAKDYFFRAWRSLWHQRKIDVNVVDATCLSVMMLSGIWQMSTIGLFLLAIAQKLLNTTKHNSRQKLSSVFVQVPATAWVSVNSVEIEKQLDDLKSADIVVVYAGDIIPVDGIITEGSAEVDQRILTGEAQPVEKQVNDSVFASTLVITGKIYLQVKEAGIQTVAAKIGEILQNTAEHKNRHETRAEKIVDQSSIPTLVISALAYPVAGVFGSLGILYSSLGYTMRITSPITMLNFLRNASELKILIKDGNALDKLNQIDTVVFDKTGTLTQEQPEVEHIHSCSDYSETELLTYAAAAECRQKHPIAEAILCAAKSLQLILPEVEHSSCKLGYGIETVIEGKTVQLGSARFIRAAQIDLPESIQYRQETAENKGNSMVLLAIDQQLAGLIELRPQLRPAAKTVIKGLHAQGIQTCIISGDREIPTQVLSHELGVDRYFADTLPEQKAKIIEQLQKEGQTLCFIGDGINDAIALKQADVSVSLSGATSAATDTAEIILMDNDLTHLLDIIALGQQFERSQKNNIKISTLPGLISIGGVFFLHTGLFAAAALFYGGLAVGVKNALRPIRLGDQKKMLENSGRGGEST